MGDSIIDTYHHIRQLLSTTFPDLYSTTSLSISPASFNSLVRDSYFGICVSRSIILTYVPEIQAARDYPIYSRHAGSLNKSIHGPVRTLSSSFRHLQFIFIDGNRVLTLDIKLPHCFLIVSTYAR